MNPVCYFCGAELIWQNDWNFEEVYGDGEGIVSCWLCPKCGGEAQFSLQEENDNFDNKKI